MFNFKPQFLQTDKVIDFISWTLLVITLVLLKTTSGYVENIIHGRKYVWNYFLLGLVIAIIWTFLFYRMRRGYFEGGEKRASAILSQFFSIIVLTIFLNAFYTYYTGKEDIYYKEVTITRIGSNIKTGKDYVHLMIDGREERFNPRREEYDSFVEGDTLIIAVGKGRTNYEFIYEFIKK